MMIYHFCEPKKSKEVDIMVTYNFRLNSHHGNTSYGISCLGVQNPIDLCLKVKCFKGYFLIYISSNRKPSKLGPFFFQINLLKLSSDF